MGLLVGASQIHPALEAQQSSIHFFKMNGWQLLNIGLLNPAFDLTPNPSPKERGA